MCVVQCGVKTRERGLEGSISGLWIVLGVIAHVSQFKALLGHSRGALIFD